MLIVAKSSLAILMKSLKPKHSWENILRRNVYKNTSDNSHPNICKSILSSNFTVKSVIFPDDV